MATDDQTKSNLLQFRPLSETLQDPFKTASLAQIALIVGLIVALSLFWIQVLKPLGEHLEAAAEEVTP